MRPRIGMVSVVGLGLLTFGASAASAQWVRGPSWDVPRSGGFPPGQVRILPGHPGVGVGPGQGQGWIGVPGLDAGYDRWRRDAERSYRQGGFHIQGWQQQPYPYVVPRTPYAPPRPLPYPYNPGWPR
ncbi:hypothetical protein BH23PLA1_BH23PLA1_04220 [soil metagenome]